MKVKYIYGTIHHSAAGPEVSMGVALECSQISSSGTYIYFFPHKVFH